MKEVRLTNSAQQFITEYLDDGNPINFTFNYRPNAFSWFVDFEYKDLKRTNIKLSAGTNILRAFQNLLPIDLYLKTSSIMREAYLADCFILGLAELYIVDHLERDEILNGEIESEEVESNV